MLADPEPPIYWYAPFDNAGEMALARALTTLFRVNLVVHTNREKHGSATSKLPSDHFRLLPNLPPPASGSGGGPTRLERWLVAHQRSKLRQGHVKRIGPALIHSHTFNIYTDWWAASRLRHSGIPLIQSVHNVRPHDQTMPRSAENCLLRRGYKASSKLVVAHSHLADRLADEFDVGPLQIQIVPLPVVRNSFGVGTAQLQSRHSPRENSVTTFLFFGTLRKNKGILCYLRAIESLPKGTMRFLFAGRGNEELEEKVHKAALDDSRIEPEIGYITAERRAQLYSEADVVVLPYLELPAQSGVLQDAYAAGRPVIATDVGALGPSVRSDGTGWVVEPGNQRRLTEALSEAHADVVTRKRFASRSESVGKERTPERIAEQLMDLYQELAHSLVGTDRHP